jgi:hypothetical protein
MNIQMLAALAGYYEQQGFAVESAAIRFTKGREHIALSVSLPSSFDITEIMHTAACGVWIKFKGKYARFEDKENAAAAIKKFHETESQWVYNKRENPFFEEE